MIHKVKASTRVEPDHEDRIMTECHLNKKNVESFFRSDKSVALFSFFIVLFLLLRVTLVGYDKDFLQLLGNICTVTALTVGYFQWRAARREASFDKYYERLKIANEKFDDWKTEELKDDTEGLLHHLNNMFVFSEIDNLEYILEKHKLGYVKQELTKRAIRAFRARCESSAEFCERTLYWIAHEEPGRAKGYEETTRKVINIITQGCKAPDQPIPQGTAPSINTNKCEMGGS